MRNTFGTILAAAAVACGTALAPLAAGATEINFLVWGGLWGDVYSAAAKAFEKQSGISVKLLVQTSSMDGLTKLKAQKNSPQVDVWAATDSAVGAATANDLLATIDPAQIPNAAKIPDQYVRPTSVVISLSPRGIAYRKDLVPFEIKDWRDLWDPRLARKVGLAYVIDSGAPLIMAALLNGGSEHDIEPGFARMMELKPNIAGVFKTDHEAVRFLNSGDFAVVGYTPLGNFYRELGPESNIRFVMPDKPKFVATVPMAIVKGRGAESEAAAAKFINYLLTVEAQEMVTEQFGQIPVNPAADVPTNLRDVVPSLPLTNVHDTDWKTVNANYAAWGDRWNKEIQSR